MTPLIVTAHLERGFSSGDRWSPALDSLLAALQLQDQVGWEKYAIDQSQNDKTVFEDLPLQKISHKDMWWWACSMPEYESSHEINRSFFKRFNIDQSLMVDKKVKSIELTKGQFKNYSLSFKEVIAKHVQWHCIGDKSEIERLLSNCNQIGSQRGKGLGFVVGWEVKEGGDEQAAMLNRALPSDFAEQNNIRGIRMWRGYRPCFRIKENQALCIMPT